MEIEINIKKKHVFALGVFLLVLSCAVLAYGFNTNNPSYFGHSVSEMDFSSGFPQDIKNSLKGSIGEKGDRGSAGIKGSCSISITEGYTKSVNKAVSGWYSCNGNDIATGADYKNSGDIYVRGLYCSKISSACA